ncbi:hypothetical protein KFE25_011416 [Diacronema lutheri]|uniref:Uncharacterized protein n=1 Tax=Diacronema lutheri TaxID=2081491 RepID=A0A8J6C731_DIALT|nr:hypothetical protein KFE25_011416 [Diacronema lutheri]
MEARAGGRAAGALLRVEPGEVRRHEAHLHFSHARVPAIWPEWPSPKRAAVDARTDLSGALSAIDLRLPSGASFKTAASTSTALLTGEANASLDFVLASFAAAAANETDGDEQASDARAHKGIGQLPAVVPARKRLPRHDEHKAMLDKATAELLCALKSVALVYEPLPALPALRRAEPAAERATQRRRRDGPNQRVRFGTARATVEAIAPPGGSGADASTTGAAPSSYSRASVREHVRSKLRSLRADADARAAFYTEMAERASELRATQPRAYSMESLTALSDGRLSPAGRQHRLLERVAERDARMSRALARKATDVVARERDVLERTDRRELLRARRVERERVLRHALLQARWASLALASAAVSAHAQLLRASRRERERKAAAKSVQRAFRAHALRVAIRAYARALRTLRRYCWRASLGTRVRRKRRAVRAVRGWLAQAGAAGLAARIVRVFRLAIVRLQRSWRAVRTVRAAMLEALRRRWHAVHSELAAAAPTLEVPPAIRDRLLLADLIERQRAWLAQLGVWTPLWRAYERARAQLRRYAETAAERAQLMRDGGLVVPASSSAMAAQEDGWLVSFAGSLAAVRTIQRMARGRNARHFWAAHRPCAPLPSRPRFRALASEEHVRTLVRTAAAHVRHGGPVPHRVRLPLDARAAEGAPPDGAGESAPSPPVEDAARPAAMSAARP